MSAAKWSYSAGSKPNTVTVFEREPGGPLYARAWDASARNGKGNWRRISLGHRDKQRAKRYAVEQAAKLQDGAAAITEGRVTLSQVFALYLEHRTPRKCRTQQAMDKVRAELWTRVLGAKSDPHNVTLHQWESFIDVRMAGAINRHGVAVTGERKPVRARTVEADCNWLRFAFNWAVKWRLPSGKYLMRENPVRGYDVPVEKNPRRPLATEDYFQAVRAVADQHRMRIQRGTRQTPRSYLAEIMDIAEGTGRRISAVCSLRYSDLMLEKSKHAPYGAIRWPEDTDKTGRETFAPISPNVRAAINRVLAERPAVGSSPLFPAPKNPKKPVGRTTVSEWFYEAERMAGIEHVKGRAWHSFRRKFATERKHLPDVDVAAAGGWKSPHILKQVYQQADPETMLAVVLNEERRRHAQ